MRASLVTVLIAAPLAATILAAPAPAPQRPLFRSAIDLINLAVTVTDRRGNLVTDLEAADFELFEDGHKQTLTYFAAGSGDGPQPPLHLGVLLDVSGSMEDDVAFTKTAAIKFLNRFTDAVDVTVIDFDTEVRVARYGQDDFARLIERIRGPKVSGDTAIYDAIGLYLDGAAEQDGRKIMLLSTDGSDTRSSLPFGDLRDLLKASDVTVYIIGMLEHQPASAQQQARMTMAAIADTTGGQVLYPSSGKELDAMYDRVLAQIRAQYTLGYTSTNTKTDGAWRKVEVKPRKDDRGLRVRARAGYYAPFRQ
jgi:Ca-activated chloride channel family protein